MAGVLGQHGGSDVLRASAVARLGQHLRQHDLQLAGVTRRRAICVLRQHSAHLGDAVLGFARLKVQRRQRTCIKPPLRRIRIRALQRDQLCPGSVHTAGTAQKADDRQMRADVCIGDRPGKLAQIGGGATRIILADIPPQQVLAHIGVVWKQLRHGL